MGEIVFAIWNLTHSNENVKKILRDSYYEKTKQTDLSRSLTLKTPLTSLWFEMADLVISLAMNLIGKIIRSQ